MSVRSDIVGNFANSFGNFMDSGINAANTIAKKINDTTEAEDRVFTSNQYNLTQSYKTSVANKVSTLPESVDFANYSQQMTQWNQEWLSSIRDSGLYDERTLNWLETEFLPSQESTNEQVVAGVQNYAMNAWVANEATSYASVLQADTSLDVDSAYNEYKSYYDSLGLSNVSSDYGIMSPETFKEEIRYSKALQAFTSSCAENYGYNTSWDVNTAIDEAMASAGYSPNAVQKIKLVQACNDAVTEQKKALQNEISQQVVNYTGEVYSAAANGSFYDIAKLTETAASYPYAFSGDLITLISTAQTSNDVILYNSIVSGSIPLSDEYLEAFNDSSYADKLIAADVTTKAKSMFNNGESAANVIAWINNGDLGYTASSGIRQSAADSVISWMKETKQNIEDLDEITAFYDSEAEQGNSTTTSYADAPMFSTGSKTSELEGEAAPESEEQSPATISQETETTSSETSTEENKTSEETESRPSKSSLVISEPVEIAPKGSSSTYLTKSGYNSAQSDNAANTLSSAQSDQYTYSMLYDMKFNQQLPDDIVLYKAKEAYNQGFLTVEDFNAISTSWIGANNETWSEVLSQVDAFIDSTVDKEKNPVANTNAKNSTRKALIQIIAGNPSILNDTAALQTTMNTLTANSTAKTWNDKMTKYAELSEKADYYNSALESANGKQIIESVADGSLLTFVDTEAQIAYAGITPGTTGSVEDMRDFFTQALGFGSSYEELGEIANNGGLMQKYIVNANVAYAKLRDDTKKFCKETWGQFMDVSDANIALVNTPLGNVFALQDSENKNLYFIPDMNTYKNESDNYSQSSSASWYYMYDTNGDGQPDSDMYSIANAVNISTSLVSDNKKARETNAAMESSEGFYKNGSEAFSDAPILSGIFKLGGWLNNLGNKILGKKKEDDTETAVKTFLNMLRNSGVSYQQAQ